jgi:6,7-dimethyl-8-ribityllumazine synthase
MADFHGTPSAAGRRVAIVVSRFNEEITQKLHDGAMEALLRHGASLEDVDVFWVPGAWELPLAARRVMSMDRYHAVVALGAVIRGETPHFDYVAGEASRALMDASTEFTVAQAEARAGGSHGNKGWDAVVAALELSDIVERLDAADEA